MIYRFGDYTPAVSASCSLAPGSRVIGDVELGQQTGIWFGTTHRIRMSAVHYAELAERYAQGELSPLPQPPSTRDTTG